MIFVCGKEATACEQCGSLCVAKCLSCGAEQKMVATGPAPVRRRLPDERRGRTLHFVIQHAVRQSDDDVNPLFDVVPVDGYVQTGEYEDGSLGEVFVKVGKSGDYHAVLDQWAVSTSVALQHGAPMAELLRKFVGARFEPSGPTNVPGVRSCTSPLDLVARWLLACYAPET